MNDNKKDIVVYRGENSDYRKKSDGKIIPSLYRMANQKGIIKKTSKYVNDIFGFYKNLLPELISIDCKKIKRKDREAAERLKRIGIMQHYNLKSILIDVTEDEDVALYFACSGNYDEDGYIYK